MESFDFCQPDQVKLQVLGDMMSAGTTASSPAEGQAHVLEDPVYLRDDQHP